MKLLFALLILAASKMAMANAGFSHGNKIGSTFYRGYANLVCTGGAGRMVLCQGIDFTPDSHDRFIYDQKTTAKKVDFLATHEDGSVTKKSTKFDAKKGRSDWVNLATSSVLQKPLLHYGVNKVQYSLKNSDNSVSRGEFNMEFKSLGTRNCATTTVFANNFNDCQNDNYICDQYFNQTCCN